MTLTDLSDEQRAQLPAYHAGELPPEVEFEITRLLCRPAVYGLYGEKAIDKFSVGDKAICHHTIVVVEQVETFQDAAGNPITCYLVKADGWLISHWKSENELRAINEAVADAAVIGNGDSTGLDDLFSSEE